MTVKEPIYLSHVVLYAKGWYSKTNDVIEDLKKILELDDYTPFTEADIVSILTNCYNRCFNIDLRDFINEIHPFNCWKSGYYTNQYMLKDNESLPEYDMYNAVVYKILSDFRFIENKDWKIKTPKYSKSNPRPKSVEIRQIYQQFSYKEKV